MGPLVPAPLAAAWNFKFKTNFRIWILSPPALLCRPSSQRHCAQCRRGSQRACTGRRLQCRRCTCTRGAPASMSSHGLLPRGSAASTDTPDSQKLGQIRDYRFQQKCEQTFPQTGHLPLSCPLLAASCMLAVTNPWLPSKCRSKPWSVKNRNWHFWQFNGGLL